MLASGKHSKQDAERGVFEANVKPRAAESEWNKGELDALAK